MVVVERVALQIVGGDGEGRPPARPIERVGGGEAFEVAEEFACSRRQRVGLGGGDDPVAGLDEEGVAEDRAELVDEVADRRLGDAEPVRRPGGGARVNDRDQEPQQSGVRVQPIEIVHTNDDDPCIYFWQCAP